MFVALPNPEATFQDNLIGIALMAILAIILTLMAWVRR